MSDLERLAKLNEEPRIALTKEEEKTLQRLLKKRRQEKQDDSRKRQVDDFKEKISKSKPHIKGYLKLLSQTLQKISKDTREQYGHDPAMRMLILAGVNASMRQGTAAVVEGQVAPAQQWAREAYQKAHEEMKRQQAEKPKNLSPWDNEQESAKDFSQDTLDALEQMPKAASVEDIAKVLLQLADELVAK